MYSFPVGSDDQHRRFLLLADLPPCENYTGGIVLNSLVRHLPCDMLYGCIILNPALTDARFASDLGIEHRFFEKPKEYGSRMTSLAREFASEFIQVPRLAAEIAKICKDQRITDIWCVLQGQTMVRFANAVADLTGLPLFTQVWDPVDWWLRDHGVNRFSRARIHADYARALRRSRGCATASIPMAREYQKNFGVRTVPVMHGLPSSKLSVAANANSDVIRIGISGQLYARREFDELIATLAESNWQLAGRPVEVHLFGKDLAIHADGPVQVFFRGWRAQSELIRDLSQLDILYCPYWFDEKFADEARNSFPSKVTTYFAAGRAVLFHGPAYASVAELFNERGCGVVCSSLHRTDLLSALMKAADSAEAAKIRERASVVFNDLFTVEAQKRAFLEFLQIGKSGVETSS